MWEHQGSPSQGCLENIKEIENIGGGSGGLVGYRWGGEGSWEGYSQHRSLGTGQSHSPEP